MRDRRNCTPHMYVYDEISPGRKVWMCAKGCGHFLPKNVALAINHKETVCWGCGNPFRLNDRVVKRAAEGDGKPVCIECVARELEKTANQVMETKRQEIKQKLAAIEEELETTTDNARHGELELQAIELRELLSD